MESWVREERENSRIEENEKTPYRREENEGDSARTTEKEMKKGSAKLCNLEGNKGRLLGERASGFSCTATKNVSVGIYVRFGQHWLVLEHVYVFVVGLGC